MKKIKKTAQEKASETYFQTNADSKKLTEKTQAKEIPRKEILKNTTEKLASKEIPKEEILKHSVEKEINKTPLSELITIENQKDTQKKNPKKRKRKTTKKISKKTAKKTTTKNENYSIPKILLKKNGYELIITEKPQAALKIASALGNATKLEINKVPYYEVDRNGKKILVACAVGHLFTLKQTTPSPTVPNFDIDWFPNYLVKKHDFTKKYYAALLKLAKNAGNLTVATDFDIEGEVIGANVVKFICGQKDAKRMKFSTLTTKELNDAYENKKDHLFWGQEIAGETRHILDWYYGINLSRALMNAIKTTGKFKIMSIGRVQGPALKLIVEKEKRRRTFVPKKYWQVFITLKKPKIELKYLKDIFEKETLKEFENLIGKIGIAQTKKTKQEIPPNTPFNLTDLQTESYKLYGITPANTLKNAQSLYLAGLISYPRTSSQKLPEAIDYKTILNKLKIKYKVSAFITRDKPLEGKKTDPAHPSIYPTGNEQILSGDEEKIYNLIVKRFLALFCDNAIIERKRITVKVDNKSFSTNGSEIKKKAWMEFYPIKTKEIEIPDIEGEVEVKDKKTEEKETQPPKRYSQASILSELEKRNLGTKATRAAILDTLYNRGYIKEKSIEATPLGMSLINTLEKYSPIIINENLTKELQDEMDEMAESNTKPYNKKEDVIEKAKKSIISISKDFKKYGEKIGKELMNAQEIQRKKEKQENKLCLCPVCKKGHLAITYSPKNRKFFVACDAYPECKTTYSLPPYGIIKKTDKVCEHCGFPMLMSLRKGKAPWFFCFNDKCPTNKKRIEEYRKKIAEKEIKKN